MKGNRKKKESQYIQGICISCENCLQVMRGVDKVTGKKIYRPYCSGCNRQNKGLPRTNKERLDRKHRPYIIYRKSICEQCGFIPVHICQLDVDHKDGNHENNNPINLQTLCANCHRLKTFIDRKVSINICQKYAS